MEPVFTTQEILPQGTLTAEAFLSGRIESKIVVELLKKFDCFIAGGFVVSYLLKNSHYGDIDVFFSSKEEKDNALEFVGTSLGLNTKELLTEDPYFSNNIFASTFRDVVRKVQLINIQVGSIEKVLGTFDFINCQAAISFNKETGKWLLAYNEEVPGLLASGKWKYQLQPLATEVSSEELKKYALAGINRLDKYLVKFPSGPWDAESRENLIFQMAYLVKTQGRLGLTWEFRKLLEDNSTDTKLLAPFLHFAEVRALLKRKLENQHLPYRFIHVDP